MKTSMNGRLLRFEKAQIASLEDMRRTDRTLAELRRDEGAHGNRFLISMAAARRRPPDLNEYWETAIGCHSTVLDYQWPANAQRSFAGQGEDA
jgi:hypothetical protein